MDERLRPCDLSEADAVPAEIVAAVMATTRVSARRFMMGLHFRTEEELRLSHSGRVSVPLIRTPCHTQTRSPQPP